MPSVRTYSGRSGAVAVTRGKLPVDVLAAFLSVRDEADLIASARRYAGLLGFDHFIYGVKVIQPFAPPKLHVCNGYPLRWRQRYDANRYVEVDPTVEHCLRSTIPLIWEDSLFEGRAREMWEEARAHGLQYSL